MKSAVGRSSVFCIQGIALFLLTLVYPQISDAHYVGIDLIQVSIEQVKSEQVKSSRYKVKWQAFNYGTEAVFLGNCTVKGKKTVHGLISEQMVTCNDSARQQKVMFTGLKAVSKDIMVQFIPLDNTDHIKTTLLNWQNNTLVINQSQTNVSVAKTYIRLGIMHIFKGLDHLLFILALLLIISDFKGRLKTITAFTVAHTLTLGLATFQIITVSRAPVEAVIALSIMLLAVEYLNQQRGTEGWTTKNTWMVSFAMGLLHGLGFADSLSSLGLAVDDIPMALLTFNVGVEMGQLMFIVAAMGFINMVTSLFTTVPAWSRYLLAYGIGSAAGIWFIQRVFGILNSISDKPFFM